MSKRLQVVIPDDEYIALECAARRRGKPLSQLVRESLRRIVEQEEVDTERRIAAVLRFARVDGPSADIEEVLADIERGRGLT
jgi:hypothetical protein